MAVSIYRQLQSILSASQTESQKRADNVIRALQKTLVEGSSLTLARKCSNDCYRTLIDVHQAGGTRIGEIHPSSSLVSTGNFPRYMVFQELVASSRSYYRNCSEVCEEDVVEVLKRIRGMKDVKLSGGSELVFYKSNGEKIQTEKEVETRETEKNQGIKSTLTESRNVVRD